eukprot:CAMPEP_0116976546 /NCGR_PEP_ID=MMETSP0467-20121206/56564_1 /TAXON_ID=283647 /ORGANISM="Mesodinium pulex, Strain SPMC105" /LENGTH=150 /DNA_ID=CAMNT_0004669373 /DNA_START=407 /DNA_END=859 /DNA_ORIENTATION=-
MTDGAAFTLRQIKRSYESQRQIQRQSVQSQNKFWCPQLENAFRRLTSSDPAEFITSGQWMTEKNGGSDVNAATSTNAVGYGDKNHCRLYGYKWFSSATDADMALSLARFPRSTEELLNNSGAIAMVYLKVRNETNTEIDEELNYKEQVYF